MRRTKAESEATRQRVVAAARRVFARRGVTRTTLEHIAAEAGVTRGAIYWHFANKTALFNAMREQIALPIVDRTDYTLLSTRDADPLQAVERFLDYLLDVVANDPDTRQTFAIMMLKCEYVDELEAELARQSTGWKVLQAKLEKVYTRARHAGALRAGLAPATAALDTCVFVSGLLRLWLLDENGTLIRGQGRRLVAAHVAAQRAAAPRSRATQAAGRRS